MLIMSTKNQKPNSKIVDLFNKREKMLYSDLYGKLILLTKRNDITHAEIGSCIDIKPGAIFARAKRNSKIKEDELFKIEQYFKVNINSVTTVDNSLQRQNNINIKSNLSGFGIRLGELQNVSNLSDKDFAKLLGLYTDEFYDLKSCNKEPNLRILNEIKQHFKVSVDWLLYGE